MKKIEEMTDRELLEAILNNHRNLWHRIKYMSNWITFIGWAVALMIFGIIITILEFNK